MSQHDTSVHEANVLVTPQS